MAKYIVIEKSNFGVKTVDVYLVDKETPLLYFIKSSLDFPAYYRKVKKEDVLHVTENEEIAKAISVASNTRYREYNEENKKAKERYENRLKIMIHNAVALEIEEGIKKREKEG